MHYLNNMGLDKNIINAVVHDLINEMSSVVLLIDVRERKNDLPKELSEFLKTKLLTCVENIKSLNHVPESDEKRIPISHEEFTTNLRKLCKSVENETVTITFTHTFKPTTFILLESLATLELILREILRNSIKSGATRISIHVSDTQDLIKIYLRDNGSGMSQDLRDKIMIPKSTRGEGGEGIKLIETLTFQCGGAISWHPIGVKGTIVKLLLQKQ